VVEWINGIIKTENLPFDRADIEILDQAKKRPDIILWEKRKTKKALLVEVKRPDADPWGEVLDDALSKAWRNNVPYFATWNVNRFFSWETFASGEVIDKLWFPHVGVDEAVVAVKSLDEIDRYEDVIKKFLRDFLKEFSDIYYQVKAKPLLAVDEKFIYRLRATIDALSIPVFDALKKLYKTDSKFRERLKAWFIEQGWMFTASDEDFEKVSRQYVLLLVNKIMFYNVLSIQRRLPKIEIPQVNGKEFKNVLQSYFKECLKEDYETIFATNFLDSIEPPDEAVEELRNFIHRISGYNFAKIEYEILGRIFEKLIPDKERHKLGQYFTRTDVVDFIVGYCVTDSDDKVLDGSCGAGTFLVRAYMKKKQLNPFKTHKELLEELYGIDIAKFPAHLATINLATKGLSEIENYPKILCADFFDIKPGKESTLLPLEYATEGLSIEKIKVKIPHFNAVVMNPPYTRQEEIEDILVKEKDKAHKVCLNDWIKLSKGRYKGKEKPTLSKRSGIYVYFFIHAASFLKEGGRLGLITSNSWLDVDYGYDLQRFFLENFKIKAIVESKIERWFEDADINTAITILERCQNPKARNENVVRFVQLKKPLNHFIPPSENESKRWECIKKFVELIEEKQEFYEDENIRIFPKKQKELWEEGYDAEQKAYLGSKWGVYIRAPHVFFEILEKGKNRIVPLKKVAHIIGGIITGNNEFFYLSAEKAKKQGIEDLFLIPVVKTPRELKTIIFSKKDLKYRLFYANKHKKDLKGTNALRYIEEAEKRGIIVAPTFKGRKYWYQIPELKTAELLWPDLRYEKHICHINQDKVPFEHNYYGIVPKNPKNRRALCAYLNSTVAWLFIEIYGRTGLGQGAIRLVGHDLRIFPVIQVEHKKVSHAFKKLCQRTIDTVFKEIGAKSANNVSLENVRADRRILDQIIMGEILGLTPDAQLEVYRAVIDLVKSRIDRAKSVKRRIKPSVIDVDSIVTSIIEETGRKLRRFPDGYVNVEEFNVINVPSGPAKAISDLQGFYVRFGDKEIRCRSPLEAKYIEYASLNGYTSIKIPKDENLLWKAVEEYENSLKETRKLVSDYVDSCIPDRKLREKIKHEVWRRLFDYSLKTER
jgi:type I restriction-modification system DNA methylase subunit